MQALTYPALPAQLCQTADYDFMQWLRLLILFWQQDDLNNKQMHPLEQIPVRFSSSAALGFAYDDIEQIIKIANDDAVTIYKVVVNFLGLIGKTGLLPLHYKIELRKMIRAHDHKLADLLDIVHHRAVYLFYRAWEKYRLYIPVERQRQHGEQKPANPLQTLLSRFAGVSSSAVAKTLPFAAEAIPYYAGFFVNSRNSIAALQHLLQTALQIELTVLPFQGQWLQLDQEELSYLPENALHTKANNILGVNLVAGKSMWTVQNKILIHLNLTDWQNIISFFPEGENYRTLCQLTSFCLPSHLSFDIQLSLPLAAMPAWSLAQSKVKLGWHTFLPASAELIKKLIFVGRRY